MCSMVSKLEALSTTTQPIQHKTSIMRADAALQTEEVRGVLPAAQHSSRDEDMESAGLHNRSKCHGVRLTFGGS